MHTRPPEDAGPADGQQPLLEGVPLLLVREGPDAPDEVCRGPLPDAVDHPAHVLDVTLFDLVDVLEYAELHV
jgi:hypothetical protein